jgi:hypothetical protein
VSGKPENERDDSIVIPEGQLILQFPLQYANETQVESLEYLSRVGWESNCFGVVFSQNPKNLTSRPDGTVIHEQNPWPSCELPICPELICEWDQHSCYILREQCCTHARLLPMFQSQIDSH